MTLPDEIRRDMAKIEADPLESGMRAWLVGHCIDLGEPNATSPDDLPAGLIDGRAINAFDMPRVLTEAAILRYHAALLQRNRCKAKGLPGTVAWEELVRHVVEQAETALIAAILLWGVGVGGSGIEEHTASVDDLVSRPLPARGVYFQDRLYLAAATDEDLIRSGERPMRLLIIPGQAVKDLARSAGWRGPDA